MMNSVKSLYFIFFKSLFHLIFQDLPTPPFFRHCDIEQDMLHYAVEAAVRHLGACAEQIHCHRSPRSLRASRISFGWLTFVIVSVRIVSETAMYSHRYTLSMDSRDVGIFEQRHEIR